MKTYLTLAIFGLVSGLCPAAALAEEGTTFGIFHVGNMTGTVECLSNGRAWDLKRGDDVLARGVTIRSKANSTAVLVFSNQTTMVMDQNTMMTVRKFEQEPFAPNNQLGVEPSNSQTVIALLAGQLTLSTPQLLSGTNLIIETQHAEISVLNTQSGSEKLFVEVNDKQTHAAVIAGLVSVKPRRKDGSFVSLGRPVKAAEQAFVKYSLNGSGKTDDNAIGISVTGGGSGAGAVASAGSAGEFTVVGASGDVRCLLPEGMINLKLGDHRFASGTDIRTAGGAKATLLFANGCSYVLGEKTDLKVDGFTQETFSPNNNLDVEPSNSQTHLTLRAGSIDISTPQLLSGSHLVCETIHSAITILNMPSGGEKATVDVDDKRTRFILARGRATVQPREADGTWSSSYPMASGQLALIKYATGAGAAHGGPAKVGVAQMAADASAVAIEPLPVIADGAELVTAPTRAKVLKISGSAEARMPGKAGSSSALSVGDMLPVGTVVTTSAGSEVYLQPFPGAVAAIRENAEVMLEKLEVTTAGGTVMKQTARLDLRKGVIVSDIDPAKRNTNDYSIRTPKGVAKAQGTAFTVSVGGDAPFVASTADTVTFTSPDGSTYAINAGNVTMTPVGGQPQPPIPLAQEVAANPGFGTVVQNAVTTIANVVQNNIGGLPANSAANLMTQIVSIASTALPAQASTFASQGVAAVTSSTSSTTSNSIGAAAAITAAAVSASPAQAAQVAAASAQAAPGMAATMAAAAASAAPTQAASIASSVLQTMNTSAAPGSSSGGAQGNGQGSTAGANLRAMTQAAASVAAAVTSAAPSQAGSVATAVMQMVTQSDPQASGGALTRSASVLANAISTSAPTQAASVATALTQVVSQTDPQGNSSAQAAAITAAANNGSAAGTAAASSSNSGNGGTSGGSTASTGGANSSSGGASSGGGNNQSTSIIVTQLNGGTNGSSTPTSTTSGATAQPTSIIVTQLNGGQLNQINSNLKQAQTAQSSVQFTSGGEAPTITSNPIVSTTPTTNNVVSDAIHTP